MIRRQKIVGIVASVLLALVGTGLLVAYVHSAAGDAGAADKTSGVLVVSETIPKGTKAEDLGAKVRLQQIPTKVVTPNALATVNTLAGKVTAVDLLPGEQLVATRFSSPAEVQGIAPGMLQVTVTMEAVRAIGGQVREGDSVAVTLSFEDPQTTHLVLHKVRVTDVRTADGAPLSTAVSGTSPVGNLLVTLAVDAPALERVIFGAEYGRMWLAWEPKEANEGGTKVQTKAGVNL
jgi:pilus assembly protein CpaB